MEAGVPGIFSNIAEISPPETPPRYNPNRSDIPLTSESPYVSGSPRAIDIVAVNPGIAPNTIPMTTPEKMNAIVTGLSTDKNPPRSISIIVSLSSHHPKIPIGRNNPKSSVKINVIIPLLTTETTQ
jgi:hypothetical protein